MFLLVSKIASVIHGQVNRHRETPADVYQQKTRLLMYGRNVD